jgi:hypothetical protein
VQNNPLSGETFQILYSALQSRANLSPIISNELAQLMQQMRKVPNPNVVGAPTRPYSLQPQQIGPSAFGSIGTSSPFVPQGKIVDSRLSGGGLRTPTAFTAAHPSSMNSGMGGGTVSAGGPIGTNPYSLQSQRDTTNIMSSING